MRTDSIWLTEADVVGLMDLPGAIHALEAGLRLQHAGGALPMGKAHLHWGEGDTLHAIGAVFVGGLFGAKTWGHTAGGATPLLILWNAEGRLEAVIEAFALGQMRTGGMSGVATGYLASPDAATLAVIGSGKQALAQVAAVAAVRPLSRVIVHSPSPGSRDAFAAKLAGHDFVVEVADSVERAVGDAEIVTTVTRAREPFLSAEMLRPDVHINAVGAITPEREELAPDVLNAAAIIAADDPDAARRLSSEVIRMGERASAVVTLASAVASDLRPAGGVTIFKAMGSGLSDLSLGSRILELARQQGVGRSIPHPVRAAPQLFVD